MRNQFKLSAGILVVAACVLSVQGAPGGPEQRTERILARQPAPVQATIRAQLGEGRLRSVTQDTEDGDVTYDVEIVRQGKVRSLTVGTDGELLDMEVFLEEAPTAVQQAIKQKVGGATLGEIDKSFDDGETSFEVEMIGGGQTRTFTLDANGKLTDEQVFISELPGDLQNAIRKVAGGGALDEITRSFDAGTTIYDVDVSESGKSLTLTFDANGVLLTRQEEIAVAEAPAAAQERIQTLSAGGKLVGVTKVTESNDVSFEVDVRQQGKLKSYAVATDGAGVADVGN